MTSLYGTRLAGKQKKISTRFHIIADVLRESNYWAKKEKQKQIPYLSCQNN
ncbi:MAG: Lon-insertion domain-containing protein [Candidatus Aminicenantaceae bacterium]